MDRYFQIEGFTVAMGMQKHKFFDLKIVTLSYAKVAHLFSCLPVSGFQS